MRKEISPELFNYNKFPGPVFVHFDQIVKSDDTSFTLLKNHKEAFDTEAFTQRFSEWLLKYDYIVGDWGNEQLRLKGFYREDKSVANTLKISRLEDYLNEHCAFGCAYFVLENGEPREIISEDEEQNKRRRKRRRRLSAKKPQKDFKMSSANREKTEKVRRRDFDQKNSDGKQHFTIRKKEQ
ncbi:MULTISPECIES: YutD family protein [Streptococcus]|uniref:YutD family protein n=1 Tax=Streptococcus caledonicus TaxID=2614158 RepID=A0ABW0UAD8_9STRE|nr:YutD family protein [Streptococcus sp. S784/96/1]